MNKQQNWTAHNNSSHIPNAVTLAAIKEADAAILRAKAGEGRNLTLDEMLKEIVPNVNTRLSDAV